MTKLASLRRRWMEDPRFRSEYEALEDEFLLAKALIEARANADLTQEKVAFQFGNIAGLCYQDEGRCDKFLGEGSEALRRFYRY